MKWLTTFTVWGRVNEAVQGLFELKVSQLKYLEELHYYRCLELGEINTLDGGDEIFVDCARSEIAMVRCHHRLYDSKH